MNIKETDLYLPIRLYLENNGYLVRSEVKDCDLTASREDELIVVELKTAANLRLLVQATERLKITDSVYVAIPTPKKRDKYWRGVIRVLRSLELGLITVTLNHTNPRVQVEFDPLPYQRRKVSARKRAVIQEIADRSGEYNEAGSSRRPIVTAYRETAILIACCLNQLGPSTTRALRALGTGEKTQSILYNNHYGWFQRVERGIYQLTEAGKQGVIDFPEALKNAELQLQSLNADLDDKKDL